MTKEAIALTPNEKLQEFLSSYGQIVLIKQHCMLQTNNDSNNVTEAIHSTLTKLIQLGPSFHC